MAHPLRCPNCSYELDSVPTQSGQCPECGHEFQREVLLRRRHDALGRGLAFIGYGSLSLILAESLGRCIAYMPRTNEGVPGDATAATEWLRLIPITFIVAGVIGLAPILMRRSALRAAASGLAVLLWVIVIHETFSSPGSIDPRWFWLQPQGWTWSAWVLPLPLYGTIGMCCVLLLEISKRMGMPSLARLAGWGRFMAMIALALSITVLVSRQFATELQPFERGRVTPGTPSQPNYVVSGSATRTLQYFSGMTRVALWLAIGLIGVTAHSTWRREAVAPPSERPEPS